MKQWYVFRHDVMLCLLSLLLLDFREMSAPRAETDVVLTTAVLLLLHQALDFGVSYGRTIAGVHFPTDNTAGLNLGQEMLVRNLPGYLREKFGADVPNAVRYEQNIRDKIAGLEHDWVKYSTGDCFR